MVSNATEAAAAAAAAACTMVAVGAVVTEDENASLSWSRDTPEQSR
jgi:hypothetical protein